jgi:hypothetical protein
MIDIDRLSIRVHGVPGPLVEEAVAGLEGELRRRLGGRSGSLLNRVVPALSIGPLDLPARSDAAALRHLLADRLLDAVLGPASVPLSQEGD